MAFVTSQLSGLLLQTVDPNEAFADRRRSLPLLTQDLTGESGSARARACSFPLFFCFFSFCRPASRPCRSWIVLEFGSRQECFLIRVRLPATKWQKNGAYASVAH